MIMHDAQIYGQLVLNNEPMSPEFIAKKVGISSKKYANLLKELEFAGIINRKENGVIFSGRMERDELARQQNRARQEKLRESRNGESNGDVTDSSRSGNGHSNGESNDSLLLRLISSSSFSEFDLKRLILRVREDFPQDDERLVDIGVFHTLIRRAESEDPSEPIRHIQYFHPETKNIIQQSVKLSSRAIDTMLEARRGRYRKLQEKQAA